MTDPALTFPESGETVYTSQAVGFEWAENDSVVLLWGLDVSEVSAGASDLFTVRGLAPYVSGVTVGGMPTSGTVYARLFWSTDGSTYTSADTTFTAGVSQPAYKYARTFDWYEQGRWYQCERCGFLFHESDMAIDPKSGLRVCLIGPRDYDDHEFGIFERVITGRRDPVYRKEVE